MKRNNSRAGFSLVELAIVLVIIGLIVGGVLKGQDLIQSARLNSVQTDLNKIRTASATFQDKYVALPGDLQDGGLVDSDLSGEGGDGNGRIGVADENGSADWVDGESADFWAHLAAAQLISGVDPDEVKDGLDADSGMSAPIGGYYKVKYETPSVSGGSGATFVNAGSGTSTSPAGHWVFLSAGDGPTDNRNVTGVMSPIELRSIDLKSDDGDPRAGDIGGMGGATPGGKGCVDGDGNYEQHELDSCKAFFAL